MQFKVHIINIFEIIMQKKASSVSHWYILHAVEEISHSKDVVFLSSYVNLKVSKHLNREGINTGYTRRDLQCFGPWQTIWLFLCWQLEGLMGCFSFRFRCSLFSFVDGLAFVLFSFHWQFYLFRHYLECKGNKAQHAINAVNENWNFRHLSRNLKNYYEYYSFDL